MTEIKLSKVDFLLLQIMPNITHIPKDLTQQGMHLDFDVPASEDLVAGLQGTLVGGD